MAEATKNQEQENSEVIQMIEEIQNADENTLRTTIEKWFESTRTSGMQIGAYYISMGIYTAIRKNVYKQKPSLRDYKRAMDDIMKIIEVQLKTEQNDSEENSSEQEDNI